MKIRKLVALFAVAVLTAGVTACDSGGGSEGGEDTSPTDTTTGDTSTGDTSTGDTSTGDTSTGDTTTGDTTTGDTGPQPDTTPTDPCDPNPCTNAPANTCDGNAVVVFETTGTCANNGGAAACTYAQLSKTDCTGTEVCVSGECKEGGDPPTTFGPGSFLSELAIPDKEAGCCFDFSGDEIPDNGLGNLLDGLGSFLGDTDVNALIAEQIEGGSFAILFEVQGLDDATNDPDITINGLIGEPSADPFDYNAALAGNADFVIDTASFDAAGDPLITFPGSKIEGGMASAGPSQFKLSIPLGGLIEGVDLTLDLTIEDTLITADASVGGNGTGLTMANGKLGGVVPLAQLVTALNALGTTCPCLNLGESDLLELQAENKIACTAGAKAATPSCTDADGDICTGIADQKQLVCLGIGALIQPDIDTDNTGKPDAFSVGLTFSAVSANLTGLKEEPQP